MEGLGRQVGNENHAKYVAVLRSADGNAFRQIRVGDVRETTEGTAQDEPEGGLLEGKKNFGTIRALRAAQSAERQKVFSEVTNEAERERGLARAFILAGFRAKMEDAKRKTPIRELAARLAALRMECHAALAAMSMRISQQARERRRAALSVLRARQKEERIAAQYRIATKEMDERRR